MQRAAAAALTRGHGAAVSLLSDRLPGRGAVFTGNFMWASTPENALPGAISETRTVRSCGQLWGVQAKPLPRTQR